MATIVKRRSYRSAIWRGDSLRLTCTAARRLFSAKGYHMTCIDEIAAKAGVARFMVFTAVGRSQRSSRRWSIRR